MLTGVTWPKLMENTKERSQVGAEAQREASQVASVCTHIPMPPSHSWQFHEILTAALCLLFSNVAFPYCDFDRRHCFCSLNLVPPNARM